MKEGKIVILAEVVSENDPRVGQLQHINPVALNYVAKNGAEGLQCGNTFILEVTTE